MTEYGNVTFTGGSGTNYSFIGYSIDTVFNDVGGVYMVTQRNQSPNGGYSHPVIYIGETGDLSERFHSHHKASCFSSNNANCICVLREDNEQNRLDIESDLLDNHSPPCNG